MARPEACHELGVVRSTSKRHCREAQGRRPPFGPGGQLIDLERIEIELGRRQELGRLVGREAKVLPSDLEQLAAGPQPGQRQRWIGARGDGEPGTDRQALDEGRHQLMDGRLVDDVIVVEHEDDRAWRRVVNISEPVQDAGHRELGVERPFSVEGGPAPRQLRDRPDQVAAEADEVVVGGIERQPAGPGFGRGEPLREQGALAETRRCGDEHESHLGRGLEPGQEPLADDESPGPRLDTQLGGEKRRRCHVGIRSCLPRERRFSVGGPPTSRKCLLDAL